MVVLAVLTARSWYYRNPAAKSHPSGVGRRSFRQTEIDQEEADRVGVTSLQRLGKQSSWQSKISNMRTYLSPKCAHHYYPCNHEMRPNDRSLPPLSTLLIPPLFS